MKKLSMFSLLAVIVLRAPIANGQEANPAEDEAAVVSFKRDIAPVLVQKCNACHNDSEAEGGYRLTTFEMAMRSGDSEVPPIVAGDLDESYLLELITEEDADLRMPRDDDPLSEETIELFRRWIQQGAKYDAEDPKAALAAIVPKQPHPDPPESYRVPVAITAVAFHPSGTEMSVGGYHEITVWNPADGSLLRRIKQVAQRTYGLAYSPDGSLLAAASGTPGQLGEVVLFGTAGGDIARELGTMADVAFGVAFSPDGTKLAACAADRSVRVYEVSSGKQTVLIEDHADWVMAVAFNHDGTRLATASRDKTSKVFDAATGESQITYPGHGEPVFSVAFNSDGTQVLTAGRDKKIHVWNPADAKKIADIGGFGGEVYKLLLVEGHVFSCSADKTVRQHKAGDRAHVRDFQGHDDYVYSLAYHHGTKRVASGSFDGEVRVWNAEDGSAVTTFLAAPGYLPPEEAGLKDAR